MPRGQHPNSLANLKKGKRFQKNDEYARECGRKSTQEKRDVAALMKEVLDTPGEAGADRRKALAIKLIKNMEKSPEWFKLGLRMIGELPAEEVKVTAGNFSALDAAFDGMGDDAP